MLAAALHLTKTKREQHLQTMRHLKQRCLVNMISGKLFFYGKM